MSTAGGLTLTVLGCDGSHAGPGGAGSGYLLRHWASATSVWLDAGPGTFARLQEFSDPLALSAIILSHEHGDHWSDLEGLVTAARWTLSFDRPPITVFAPSAVAHSLRQDADGILDWHEVGDGDGVTVGPLRFTFHRTVHPVETLAVRLDSPTGVLGYSADSGPEWPLRTLGTDLDLALCEATYTRQFEENEAIHMSGAQAGQAARQAGARRLVVTHRWAKIPAAAVEEEAAQAFGAPVLTAEVGRGFSL